MPRLPLLLLCSLFLLLPAYSQDATITAAQAKDNIGQSKTVVGTVMKIAPVGKLTILDIDGVYPNAPFQAVIFADKIGGFDKTVLDGYQGKSVSITGKITEHKGRPQIVLNEPSQIALAGQGAATSSTPTPAPASDNTATTPTPQSPAPPAPAAEAAKASAPTPAPGKSFLANSNWNKGKKNWELPPKAEVVTDGESQVVKIVLSPSETLTLTQTIEAKVPKDTKHFQLAFDAKLADGAKSAGLTVRLGPSPKDGSSKKFKDLTTSWQTLKWERTGDLSSTDNLVFTVEFEPGDGAVLLDNFQLTPAP